MNAHQRAQEGRQTPAPAGVASVPTVDAAAVLAALERLENEVAVWRDLAEANMGPDQPALIRDLALVLPLAREVVALRARAERAESDRDGYRATVRDTLALVDDRDALLDARVAERVAAEDRVAPLVALLRSVEWVNMEGGSVLWCPRCGWAEQDGHSPACPLGAALAGGD